MSIKEKSKFVKHEFEYSSPDGDKWDFVIVEYLGNKFVQFQKIADDPQNRPDPTTIDGNMLLDMADAYRKVFSMISSSLTSNPAAVAGLRTPVIQDHRLSAAIQSSVDETMKNQDPDVKPFQTLSNEKAEYAKFRTGLDIENRGDVPETPPEYEIKENEGVQWKKDVIDRKHKKIQINPESEIKRVGAGDLI
jgi:hypothetical protein